MECLVAKENDFLEESQKLAEEVRRSEQEPPPMEPARDDLLKRIRGMSIDPDVWKWVTSGLKPPR